MMEIISYAEFLVDYDQPQAIAQAIAEVKFTSKHFGITLSEIPLVGAGQVRREVFEVSFGEKMYNKDLPGSLLLAQGEGHNFKSGLEFSDPLTALRFAYIDQQTQHSLVVLFTNNASELCHVFLDKRGHLFNLGIDKDHQNACWGKEVHFLTIPTEKFLAA